MDMKQMKYFLTVIEEGSITAAAKRLHISQPPLSYQMKLLEQELGVELLERDARGVQVTEAGHVLYRYAKEMTEMEQMAREEMTGFSRGIKGTLRIGMISSAGTSSIYREMKAFHDQYPQVQFKVYEGNTYRLLDDLRNNRIELAVVRTPFAAGDMEGISLDREPMLAVARQEFLGDWPENEISLAMLEEKPLILYRRWEGIIRGCFQEQGKEPNVICINDDARTCAQWALAGMGIALIPASMTEMTKGLVIRPLAEETLVSQIRVIRRKGVPATKTAQAFYEMFRALGQKTGTNYKGEVIYEGE